MKKKTNLIKDIIYNNPRADRQDKSNDDKIEDINKRMTLYDENNISIRMKMIDKIIRNYKAQKMRLKAQEIEQDNIKEQKGNDLITRMVKGYNKNRRKIENKPNQPQLSQSEKRKRKLADLTSRSSSWSGLEHYNINEDLNEYMRDFRKLHYSNKRMTFREWISLTRSLIDTLQ